MAAEIGLAREERRRSLLHPQTAVGAMRAGASDAELTQLISDTWTRRTDRYSEVRSKLKNGEQPLRKIEMYYIGG